MESKVQRVDYFYSTIKDQPGEAYKVLSSFEELGINLLAITAIPFGPESTQLSLFPKDSHKLVSEAKKAGMNLNGPYGAFLVQGDDEIGALSKILIKLYEANINVYASNGISSGNGHFGFLFYVRPEKYEQAAKALGI